MIAIKVPSRYDKTVTSRYGKPLRPLMAQLQKFSGAAAGLRKPPVVKKEKGTWNF